MEKNLLMSEVNWKRTKWRFFIAGCICGSIATLLFLILLILIGANTLKFWIAKKEVGSLKTPRIQISEGLDYHIKATNMEGREISFDEFQGKPLFILVWHPECVHCLSTLITSQALNEKLKDMGIPVLALTEANKEEIEKVQKELSITVPVFMVKKEVVQSLCGSSVPCSLIVNSEGKIVFSFVGGAHWGSEEVVQFLLNLAEN